MTWDDITIEQFAELQKTFKDKPDNIVDKLNQRILQTSIITGKDLDEVERMTLKELDEIDKLIKTPLPTKLHKRFRINGIVYEFITNARELAGGQYMSIMESIKEDPFDHLHVVMFNISRPIKITLKGFKSYEFEASEIPDRIEDFKKMPISIANPIAVFFCNLSKDLMISLQDYSLKNQEILTKRIKQMIQELEEDLQDGDG